jgi:hypothetical protein
MRAEHHPRAQLRQRAQLVEHKFFERVVRHKFIAPIKCYSVEPVARLIRPQAEHYTRSIK